MTNLSELSVADLAEGICLRAGRIAAAQAELLAWIGEFDRREGWAGKGMLSCAHWLSWRIGLSLNAAREQVRVARRLEELPAIAGVFADGTVSYSKVRAITRVAEPDDGVDWVALARHSSAAQLEKIVRGVRRARANEAAALDPEGTAWSLRTRTRYDDNGNFSLTITGPAEYLPALQAGIEAKKAELQRERDAAAEESPEPPLAEPEPEPEPEQRSDVSAETPPEARDEVSAPPPVADLDQQAPGWPEGTTWGDVRAAFARVQLEQERRYAEEGVRPEPQTAATSAPEGRAPIDSGARDPGVSAETPELDKVTDADALLAMSQEALDAERAGHPDIARRRRPALTARVDPLSGWARLANGELLPPSCLREVMKTLPGRDGLLRLRPITPADLSRYDLGRTQREANAPLREALGVIDGERCRFPGCTRHRKLHAHHVVYWSQGGRTDLDNLVLVCSRHHTLIHKQGFILVLHPDRRLEVLTADGVAVLHHPAQPWGDPAALAFGSGQRVSAETLPPDHCTARMDLGYVVNVLLTQAA